MGGATTLIAAAAATDGEGWDDRESGRVDE
jgi:hypothetical protein